MNYKQLFGKDLLRSVFQKGVITAVIAVMVPTSLVVAEPSLGTAGSSAIADAATVVAKPAITRFIGRHLTVEVSAYNAVAAQTDDTPCIAANGDNICDPAHANTIASNFLPFGKHVIIPSLGDTVYVVRDRMNARYQDNIDVLVTTVSGARQIGRRDREVIVLD